MSGVYINESFECSRDVTCDVRSELFNAKLSYPGDPAKPGVCAYTRIVDGNTVKNIVKFEDEMTPDEWDVCIATITTQLDEFMSVSGVTCTE